MKSLLVIALSIFSLHAFADGTDYDKVHSGVYEVPISNFEPELEPFKAFPIEGIETAVRNGKLTVEYPLPKDLTGVEQTIVLTGDMVDANQPVLLHGGGASALCLRLQCTIDFKSVESNLDALKADFEARGLSSEEIGLRLRVSRGFVEDPHGILILNASERNQKPY